MMTHSGLHTAGLLGVSDGLDQTYNKLYTMLKPTSNYNKQI